VGQYQKGKSNLGHMQDCTLLQADNHASTPPLSFLQAGCPSCRPMNSVKALKTKQKAKKQDTKLLPITSQNNIRFSKFFDF